MTAAFLRQHGRRAQRCATRWLVLALCVLGTTGCAVVAVADAAVTVVATGVKVGAKAVGAVVDVVVPDGDAEK